MFELYFVFLCVERLWVAYGKARKSKTFPVFFGWLIIHFENYFFPFSAFFWISVSLLLCFFSFSAFCYFVFPCFSAFIVLWFSASPLFCFSASSLLRFSASPLFCFSLLFCFSSFFASLLSAFPCFFAFLLLCFSFFLFLILQIILKKHHINSYK